MIIKNTKAILEYSPEKLPKKSGDNVCFDLRSIGLAYFGDEYRTENVGNLIKVIKK